MSKFVRALRTGKPRQDKRSRHCILRLERLESRDLLTAFTATQIRHAYGIDQIAGVTADGTGQTIAIVDAYDDPTAATDLAQFNSSSYGIPFNGSAWFKKVNQSGVEGNYPAYNSGWAQEIALDVEWAHAVAPGANILLVEANSSSFSDLLTAVDYAKNQPGVVAVSMSWGSSEFSGESGYDSHFVSGGHPVSFIASSGDSGAVTSYPAVSPNVLGVGGTTLTTTPDGSGSYVSENGWSSSGGGVSKYESKPSYQSSVTQSSSKRTSPDVSYNADPNTGVYVIFKSSLYVFGGTSAGAPQWAGLVAIADDIRNDNSLAPLPALDGRGQLLPNVYTSQGDFHDVLSGSTRSGRTTYSAGSGYDLVTGIGSPISNKLVADLVQVTAIVSSQSSGSGGGGSGRPFSTNGSGDGCGMGADPGAHLARPTAVVLELVDAHNASAVGLLTSDSLALSDALFGESEFQAGLSSLAGSNLQPAAVLLTPTLLQSHTAVWTATISSLSARASLHGLAEDDDGMGMADSDQISSDQQAVDLALAASTEWEV